MKYGCLLIGEPMRRSRLPSARTQSASCNRSRFSMSRLPVRSRAGEIPRALGWHLAVVDEAFEDEHLRRALQIAEQSIGTLGTGEPNPPSGARKLRLGRMRKGGANPDEVL